MFIRITLAVTRLRVPVYDQVKHQQAYTITWPEASRLIRPETCLDGFLNVTNTMTDKLMILPSKDAGKIRLLKIPQDYESHEVYRAATGAIARAEENVPDYNWEDLMEELEDMGFEEVSYILGPEV